MCTFVFKGDFYKECGLLIAKQPHHLDRATSMVHSQLQGIEEKVTAVTKMRAFCLSPNQQLFFWPACVVVVHILCCSLHCRCVRGQQLLPITRVSQLGLLHSLSACLIVDIAKDIHGLSLPVYCLASAVAVFLCLGDPTDIQRASGVCSTCMPWQ